MASLITRFCVAPANVHELSVLPELVEHTSGVVVGARNYWSPSTREELAKSDVDLLAPYRNKGYDPRPQRSAHLSRVRYRIDTVFGQLVDRYRIKLDCGRETGGTWLVDCCAKF